VVHPQTSPVCPCATLAHTAVFFHHYVPAVLLLHYEHTPILRYMSCLPAVPVGAMPAACSAASSVLATILHKQQSRPAPTVPQDVVSQQFILTEHLQGQTPQQSPLQSDIPTCQVMSSFRQAVPENQCNSSGAAAAPSGALPPVISHCTGRLQSYASLGDLLSYAAVCASATLSKVPRSSVSRLYACTALRAR
jgi:hypothetical protein